jgi:hypothetical protein
MATRITVHGVDYPSVDAMPDDVRQQYEAMLAHFPDLAFREGEGVPEVVENEYGPLRISTSFRQKFVVNGTPYASEASMPPEVRRMFEQAMRTARASEPTVKKNEFTMSFKFTGPPKPERTASVSAPAPIEPGSAESRVRVALVVAAGAAVGLVLWLWARTH